MGNNSENIVFKIYSISSAIMPLAEVSDKCLNKGDVA
jgi:hypothetical protein